MRLSGSRRQRNVRSRNFFAGIELGIPTSLFAIEEEGEHGNGHTHDGDEEEEGEANGARRVSDHTNDEWTNE